MRRTRLLAATAAFSMICAPAALADPIPGYSAGQETDPAAQPAETAAEVEETPEEIAWLDQRVCRAGPRPASRLESRSRICLTRREWRDQEAETQRDIQNLTHGSRFSPPEPR